MATGIIILTITITILASSFLSISISEPRSPLAVPLVAATNSAFAVSALLLLPIDAVSAAPPQHLNGTAVAHPPSSTLVAFWRALYWVTLLLGWLATETLCELLNAGDFTRAARLRSALKASMRIYGLILGLGLAGLLYLLIWLHVPFSELQSVAALLVNGHGVLVLALLQGQGMVELPRRLWRTAAPRAALAQKYYSLAAAEDERSSAAGRLRTLLHKVAAADSAAPPPASRGVRERLCWDALLRSARAAAAECSLEEHDGGRLAWGLRAAWAHTLGTPATRDEASLAKLRRRVRSCGGVARRAWQRRQACLHDAAALCEQLTANEKGFGGLGVGRSRGLWLGVMRAPCFRLVAVLAGMLSAWLLVNEACGMVRVLPPPLGQRLPAYCPAPLLDSVLLASAPSLAYLADLAGMSYAALCAMRCLRNSRILAPCPLMRWRQTDGVSLLRHAAWAVRLAGPLASHYLLVATSRPEHTAVAVALESIWKLKLHSMGLAEGGRAEGRPALDAGPLGGAAEPPASGAMAFHGLCSLLMLLASGCSLAGMCGCNVLLGLSTDPACKRYDGKPAQKSQVRRGERLARHHLANAGALAAAGCDVGGVGAAGGGLAGALSIRGLDAGLCSSSGLGGGGGGGGSLAPSLLLDGEETDAEEEEEEYGMGGFATPRGGKEGSGGTPRSAFARLNFPTPPGSCGSSRSAAAASAPGNVGGGRRRRGGEGGGGGGEETRLAASRSMWARLVLGHEGGALSSETEDNGDGSSGQGSSDDAYSSLPSWAARPAARVSQAGRNVTDSRSTESTMPSAKRVWDAIRSGGGSCGGGGGGAGSGSDGTGGGCSWCELTPCTGGMREVSLEPEPSDAARVWSVARAGVGEAP